MAEDITTIKVTRKTKERLEHLRTYKRESYEEIMQKLFQVLNLCRLNPESARARLINFDRERRRNLKPEKQEYKEYKDSKESKAEKLSQEKQK